MLFVCYPKCTTCQKARKWLEEQGISYEERDIKTENPQKEELKEWYKKSGLPLKKFFNTSGMLYKQMNLKDKLPDMSEEEQLELLATDGMLVKRPIVVDEDIVLTGFKAASLAGCAHPGGRYLTLGGFLTGEADGHGLGSELICPPILPSSPGSSVPNRH